MHFCLLENNSGFPHGIQKISEYISGDVQIQRCTFVNFIIQAVYNFLDIRIRNSHPMLEIFGLDDNKKIGMLLIALAALFQTIGVMLFFKRSLILISNVLFLSGLYFFVGLAGIISFFTRKGKIKGSIIYFCGFILIVFGMEFLGTLVEVAGFLIIFRQFLPDFYDYICKIPVVGRYLKSYTIQNALDSFAGNQRSRI